MIFLPLTLLIFGELGAGILVDPGGFTGVDTVSSDCPCFDVPGELFDVSCEAAGGLFSGCGTGLLFCPLLFVF